MDGLTDMALFARVVTAGGLSAAARELGLSPAVVSKRLARLEDRLGARLLHRTTRRISLTDEGAGYFERAQRILAEIEEAEAAVSRADLEPRGTLRVTVPASFGRLHVAPAFPEFLARYPRLRLVVTFTDAVVDIVEGGYDLAVRVAELKDSSLIARKLAPNRRVICAAPAYLERHGVPATPNDLTRHNCLIHTALGPWTLIGPDGGEHTCAWPVTWRPTTPRCCATRRRPGSGSRSPPRGTPDRTSAPARSCPCSRATPSPPGWRSTPSIRVPATSPPRCAPWSTSSPPASAPSRPGTGSAARGNTAPPSAVAGAWGRTAYITLIIVEIQQL